MRILVVEDDEPIAEAISLALTSSNNIVDTAYDGQAGWDLLEAYDYDLVLLDVILPKLDGVGLCQKLRNKGSKIPVLMMTAKGKLNDKVLGLDSGADDYLVKPFELAELEARIRALMRRRDAQFSFVLRWEKLELDPNGCTASFDMKPLPLTPKEYGLLEIFLRAGSRVLSRTKILELLWSADADAPSEEAVKMHIRSLRQKLKSNGAPDDLIQTVYGLGYKLRKTEQS
ncbi:two component transcriptional regulator, winged helix family [Thalassoporum mexicanum PCC 7367]|uniref:response regulator transcription factor n=1 Tax=Thalassoporum mexicanum TaxID=3457544 RepID=UPI00029FE82B|nr:response regulator transcription factor [Pseudanabaena sp. PCC 7367]AFY71190.1 two component transcriptional regulator, winged helix family [Pseudanabaena sp. PCC 7367]